MGLAVMTMILPAVVAFETRSVEAFSRTEGQLPATNDTFVRFKGTNGLQLELTMPRERNLDYTVMFWFRSSKSFDELKQDLHILNTKAYLFDLPGSAACWISRSDQEDPFLECSPGPN